MDANILVVNCGSSSVKLALFDRQYRKRASALAELLNSDAPKARISGDYPEVALPQHSSHSDAIEALVAALKSHKLMTAEPSAIGHRIVHGGETFHQAALINDETLQAIAECSDLAPLHNPINLSGIRATQALFPAVPQVAVFDTAYHQTLPKHAYLYAVPASWYQDWGVRRYGFHGISHSHMVTEAARRLGRTPATTSIISAHLGNGCSVAAIRDGISVDTSMGLTPLEGLMMGTRSGDVDPGLFDYLATKGITAKQLHHILNHDSGLRGVSGQTNDMRALCELADHGHEPSATAIDIFCFRLAKYVAAMMASLDRLDALVFTGGIGENSARVRRQTIDHLRLLGFELDPSLNGCAGEYSNGRIESVESRFPVMVIGANEELVIAREAGQLADSQPQL